MATAKKIFFGLLGALITYLVLRNSFQQVDNFHYFPFVKPIRDAPVIVLLGFAFGVGVLSVYLLRWWNTFRKKVKKEL